MLPGGGGGVGPREERGATPSPSLGQGLSTFPTSAKRPRTSDSWNQRNPYQKVCLSFPGLARCSQLAPLPATFPLSPLPSILTRCPPPLVVSLLSLYPPPTHPHPHP